jgi:hypothetical protein
MTRGVKAKGGYARTFLRENGGIAVSIDIHARLLAQPVPISSEAEHPE